MGNWSHYFIASLMLCLMLAHGTRASRAASNLGSMDGGAVHSKFDAGSQGGPDNLHHEGTAEGRVDDVGGSNNIGKHLDVIINGGSDTVRRGSSCFEGGDAELIGNTYVNNIRKRLDVAIDVAFDAGHIGCGGSDEGRANATVGGSSNIGTQLDATVNNGSDVVQRGSNSIHRIGSAVVGATDNIRKELEAAINGLVVDTNFEDSSINGRANGSTTVISGRT